MKYTCELEINKPVDTIVDLFLNQDNLYKWMDGLQNLELIEGEYGKPGAKTKLVFDMNGKHVEMIETLKVRNLPEEFTVTFDAKGVHNIQTARFEKLDEEKTKYISENEFQFKGFMKLMNLMPWLFKKQTMKYMKKFKEFAESEFSDG